MVFFTSVIIVAILYYLQADGLIYITILAVMGELVNLFMTQTITKATEKKTTMRFSKVVQGYQTKINAQKKTIKELEGIQEDAVHKMVLANQKIREYEEKLGITDNQSASLDLKSKAPGKKQKAPAEKNKTSEEPEARVDDLPAGSNRKELPV